MKKLILASNSPRRKELLQKAGFDFIIKTSGYEEKALSIDAEQTAKTFACGKAQSVFNQLKDKSGFVVIGADTVVCLDGEILGKAESPEKARQTLNKLSARTHSVITGYCIKCENRTYIDAVESKVTFNRLSERLIDEYVNSGKYQGKAGAYGIQDGYALVKEYSGSLTNVIGLPIENISPILKELIGE